MYRMRYSATAFLCLALPQLGASQVTPGDSVIIRKILNENGVDSVSVSDVATTSRSNLFLFLPNLGITQVSPEIGQLQNLTHLDLSDNSLEGLPDVIGSLPRLVTLDISGNVFDELPLGVTKVSSLTNLDVSSNNVADLPDEIEHLSSLVSFNASGNRLTSLPSGFAQLQNLSTLRLSDNDLAEYPSVIASLSDLSNLEIADNFLSELPPQIGVMTNLNSLDLRENGITDLPPEIMNLKELYTCPGSICVIGGLRIEGNRLCTLSISLQQWLDSNWYYAGREDWRDSQDCSTGIARDGHHNSQTREPSHQLIPGGYVRNRSSLINVKGQRIYPTHK